MSLAVEPEAMAERLPPGPVGTVAELVAGFDRDPFRFLKRLAGEYGSMFTLQLGAFGSAQDTDVEHNGHWVFLTKPHQVKIMHDADQGTVNAALANKVFFGVTDDGSVGYIDGRCHRRRRSQLLPEFSGRRDYAAVVTDVVRRCMARWPREEQFELFPELQRMTSEVIVRVVCGDMEHADRSRLCALMPKTETAGLGDDELHEADSGIRGIIDLGIEGYLEKSLARGQHDVLAKLLAFAADGDASLSNDVVRDEVFSLLYTGFSTTANTLSWAFVRILRDARVHRRLVDELGHRFIDGPLAREDFSKLSYVEATIKETLRLHPVSALNGVRMVTRPLELDGYVIPPGTFLVQCAYLLQRSHDIYDDAETFLPERFLDKRTDPSIWAPFGGGDRTCVGRGFAIEEMKMVLALVFSALRIELVGEFPDAKRQGLFMAPVNGVPCVIRN